MAKLANLGEDMPPVAWGQKQKEEAMKNYAAQEAQSRCGQIGKDPETRGTLSDRLYASIRIAEVQSIRAARAQELLALLEKNPDVAAILDLIEQGGF